MARSQEGGNRSHPNEGQGRRRQTRDEQTPSFRYWGEDGGKLADSQWPAVGRGEEAQGLVFSPAAQMRGCDDWKEEEGHPIQTVAL